MIAVIADDFTSAAEIAGIGWNFGLKTEIQTEFNPDTDADLVAVDMDSRSCSPSEAADRVKATARLLIDNIGKIDWVYKKIDSVLRGPVAAELHALLEMLDYPAALLIPGNPSKGRVVCDGRYLINGQPLNETDFANDAEYPATSSDVLEILGLSQSKTAGLLSCCHDIPDEGIWIGQAQSCDELSVWAEQIDKMLPVGAADFFTAILQKRCPSNNMPVNQSAQMPQRSLFVFGSSSAYSRAILDRAYEYGRTVCRLPDGLWANLSSKSPMVQQWADEIVSALEDNECVIAAIDRPAVIDAEFARKLTGVLSEMMRTVMDKKPELQLYVEGGATASAIVRRIGWKRFVTAGELTPGVVQMHPDVCSDCSLTIKPGSYSWPEVTLELLFGKMQQS